MMKPNLNEGYILEFVRVGDFVKVSAIDPKSGIEACIMTPVKGVTQKQRQDLAIQKLKYVINKSKEKKSNQ